MEGDELGPNASLGQRPRAILENTEQPGKGAHDFKIIYLLFKNIIYVCVLPACTTLCYMHNWYPQNLEEFPGTGLIESYGSPYMCWESNPVFLEHI